MGRKQNVSVKHFLPGLCCSGQWLTVVVMVIRYVTVWPCVRAAAWDVDILVFNALYCWSFVLRHCNGSWYLWVLKALYQVCVCVVMVSESQLATWPGVLHNIAILQVLLFILQDLWMTLLLRFSFGGKTLASIWGAGAGVVIPSRPFASLSLPPNTAYWLECSVWMWNKVLLFYIKNILIFHSLILHSLFDALRLDATRFTFPQCERVWARSLCVPIRFPKISSWLSGQPAQMTFRKRLSIQYVCCMWLSPTYHRFLKVLSTHY